MEQDLGLEISEIDNYNKNQLLLSPLKKSFSFWKHGKFRSYKNKLKILAFKNGYKLVILTCFKEHLTLNSEKLMPKCITFKKLR